MKHYDKAFALFASAYPHEAYELDKDRYWRYVRQHFPGVTKAVMKKILRQTKEGKQ